MIDDVDHLIVERRIARQVHRYARAVDRADWAAVRDCYTKDALDDHGAYKGDVAGLVADMETRHSSIDSSVHLVSNIVVDLHGPGDATSEAYCLAFQAFDTDLQRRVVVTSCRYLDRWTLEDDGQWRVTARTVAYDWSEEHVAADMTPAGATRSTRDGTDPLWALAPLLHAAPKTSDPDAKGRA